MTQVNPTISTTSSTSQKATLPIIEAIDLLLGDVPVLDSGSVLAQWILPSGSTRVFPFDGLSGTELFSGSAFLSGDAGGAPSVSPQNAAAESTRQIIPASIGTRTVSPSRFLTRIPVLSIGNPKTVSTVSENTHQYFKSIPSAPAAE
jgi:hypothetical protein